ncbi:MAG TPA: hypothetical protein VND45_12100 [Thermoanaerobaculia bacterium]|nr:hypothetical protein [Thermoanaerobaculia bacterium]
MRRSLALALLLVASDAFGAEKWLESYNKGVEAVNARRYAEAVPLLQSAIVARPMEATELKVSMTIVAAYTPHFWMGIAKFNVGEIDAALREWRISEEQGAIARTPYYSRLKDWVARAQTEKQLQAEKAASGPKKNASAAIGRAVELQVAALTSGGDRTDAYRDAQRRLQDAQARFRQAGTNGEAYESVAQIAEQAAQSFSAAADEGKRIKAAAANRPKPAPPVVVEKPVEVSVPFEEPVRPDPLPVAPPAAPPERRAEARPTLTETVAPVIEKPGVAPKPVVAKADVTPAYRAFATGDLATAERLLNRIIATTPAAEAYLLRGCVRYTRAMLSQTPDALLLAATDDFKAALERNAALRLDRRVFSPKLVERFEQVRSGR